MPFSIVERDGRIAVSSPYHPDFPSRARGLGGSWDALRHVWLFDLGDHDRVASLCREIYGGTAPPPIPTPRSRTVETSSLKQEVRGRTISATASGCASG